MTLDDKALDFEHQTKALYYQNRREVFRADLDNISLSEDAHQFVMSIIQGDY
jgi:hypothetical protein